MWPSGSAGPLLRPGFRLAAGTSVHAKRPRVAAMSHRARPFGMGMGRPAAAGARSCAQPPLPVTVKPPRSGSPGRAEESPTYTWNPPAGTTQPFAESLQ